MTPTTMIKHHVACLLLLIISLFLNTTVAYQGFATTGDYVTGVHDFYFTDTTYPSAYMNDADGRRLMARVYYPVCEKDNLVISNDGTAGMCNGVALGRLREYLEPGEPEAFFPGIPLDPGIFAFFNLTNSYLDAPPLEGDGDDLNFPVVVSTHGAGSWVSENTALLEEIASHGYTVFALASPGHCSGILFADTMEVVTRLDYPEIDEAIALAATQPYILAPPFSDDLQVRYDIAEGFVNAEGGVASLMGRVRDDQLALVDYLLSDDPTRSDLLEAIIANIAALESGVVYMGYSMGGAAAGMSAQLDPRAVGAISLDGMHQYPDLFGRALRVPYMHFWGDDGAAPFYYNEFYFEPVETMGSNPNITRVGMVTPVWHGDFNDFALMDQMIRQGFGANHTIDGQQFIGLLADFSVGFCNTVLKEEGGWTPMAGFDAYPDLVYSVDVSYVAEWAAEASSVDETVGEVADSFDPAIETTEVQRKKGQLKGHGKPTW